jgi:tetratricopeptide (TPR) repeat protein
MKGMLLMNSHGDDKEIKALMQQALNVNSNYFPALTRLGQMYAGDSDRIADGVELMERALTIDPKATWIREALATLYLHMGEGAAAQDVMQAEGGDMRGVQACVLLLQGNEQGAAQFAYAFLSVPHPGTFPTSELCAAASIRNEAIRTGQYDRAIRVLQGQYSQHVGSLEEDDAVRYSVIWGLAYAEVLLAKGEQARGTQLARAILAEIERVIDHPDTQPMSRYWRARALSILGERSEAMAALESAVAHGFTFRPWMFDHEPSIVALRSDPRYQKMFARQTQWVDEQRAMLTELRKAHRIPQRPLNPTTGSAPPAAPTPPAKPTLLSQSRVQPTPAAPAALSAGP